MTEQVFQGIELKPSSIVAKQLFLLLHGLGAASSDLLPLAQRIRVAFPDAAIVIPDGISPFDGGGAGRQWFSIQGITEDNRAKRVAEAIPALHSMLRQARERFNILPSDTALVGFSQGAILALEFSKYYDGGVGRILAFSGRFAKLPEKAAEYTTLHLLHGEDDQVIPVSHAYIAFESLSNLQGDVTLDVASSVGHELHPILADRAINRLQTCIPLRSWQRALNSA